MKLAEELNEILDDFHKINNKSIITHGPHKGKVGIYAGNYDDKNIIVKLDKGKSVVVGKNHIRQLKED
jgi:hypothetical protein